MRNAEPKWQTPGLAKVLFLLWGIIAIISAVVSFSDQRLVTGFVYLGSIVGAWVWTELTLVIFEIHKVLLQIRDQGNRPQRERTMDGHTPARKAVQRAPGEMRLG